MTEQIIYPIPNSIPNVADARIQVSAIRNPILRGMAGAYNESRGKFISTGVCAHSKGSHSDHSKGGGGGGCYLTTACLRALGKPQDSLEFRAMKVLTKEHILKSMQGKRDYVRYGRQAPNIVKAIEARPDASEIWGRVYEKLGEVADLVFSDRREEGYQSYKTLVSELSSKTLAS